MRKRFSRKREDLAGIEPRAELTWRVCHRNQGVGADGVEFLTWGGERDGTIRLHNADGSIAEIPGNGTRCVAAWIAYETRQARGMKSYSRPMLEGVPAALTAARDPVFRITSSMGVPEVQQMESFPLAGGERIEGAVVSTGNPHFVIVIDQPDFDNYPWQAIGEEIC